MNFLYLICISLLLSLIAASTHAEGNTHPSDAQAVSAGEEIFLKSGCAHCHGQGGNGGVPLAGQAHLSPDYVRQIVENGRVRGNKRMPPWKGVLSDEEITQVTAYVMSLQ